MRVREGEEAEFSLSLPPASHSSNFTSPFYIFFVFYIIIIISSYFSAFHPTLYTRHKLNKKDKKKATTSSLKLSLFDVYYYYTIFSPLVSTCFYFIYIIQFYFQVSLFSPIFFPSNSFYFLYYVLLPFPRVFDFLVFLFLFCLFFSLA